MITGAQFRAYLFGGTALEIGDASAREACRAWRAVFKTYPVLRHDLLRLSGMLDPDLSEDGGPLSDDLLRQQAGAKNLALAIFARAEFKEADIRNLIEEKGDEHDSLATADYDDTDFSVT